MPRQEGGVKMDPATNNVKRLVGMVGVVQNITLPGYNKMKIGEAFDRYRYFKKREWSETRPENGKYYIIFTGVSPVGWLDLKLKRKGISDKGIEINFYIYPNGTFGVGMVSKIEVGADGKRYSYPVEDSKSIFDAIYANREISY
jgi:hypothetical protein